MSNTKQRILNLLEVNGGLTTSELGEMLELSTTAVRRHLNELEEKAVIAHYTDPKGAGRPSFVFDFRNRAAPKTRYNRDAVLNRLFKRVLDLARREGVDILMALRQEKYYQRLISQNNGETLSERVGVLAQLLDEAGRLTTWQKLDKDCYILREHNCPFNKCAKNLNQLCRYEKVLLEDMLRTNVQRISHIVDGDVTCAYVIG